MLHPNPSINRLLQLFRALLWVGGALLFYKLLFRPLVPLGVAFLLSGLIAGPAHKLKKHSGLPIGLCALLLTLVFIALLCSGSYLLIKLAISQCKVLMAQLPALLESIQKGLDSLQAQLDRRFSSQRAVPDLFSPAQWLNRLQPPEIGLESLADPLSWAASSLPNLLLTAVFILAATIMLTSRRQEILGFVKRQLPPRLLEALQRLKQYLTDALVGWCKAQGILAAVTFGILLTGFFFLRIQAGLLLAFVIALLDSLPLLGAGIVLIPWALMELLLSNPGRAAGLALLFAVLLVVRNALEPHIVGKQIGLHPFVSLLSFYLGWRLAGLLGMVLLPCAMLILVKLQEWGYSKLWR